MKGVKVTMERLGDRIARLMKECGYKQQELASMVGVTQSAMSRYLSNEREPKSEVIANLATALNTTSDYLIRGKEIDCDFAEIYHLVARSTIKMSDDEKRKLMKVLLD